MSKQKHTPGLGELLEIAVRAEHHNQSCYERLDKIESEMAAEVK